MAEPGPYQPKVTVTTANDSGSALGSATVHQASKPAYAAGFDSVCFGNVGDSVPCDGDRAGLSREALVAAGGVPGKLLTVPGTDLRFSMPGIPVGDKDNATGAGQTLPVTLAPGATKLSLIGTAHAANQDTTATVNFTDGSSTSYKVQYGDWCGSAQFGNVVAIQMAYRLNGTGTDGCQVKLFATAPLTVPAGKTVESVTLPTQTGDPTTAGRIHVFAVADNGSALEVAAGADTTAKAGADTDVTLGTAKGGVPASTGYTARVQWGDGTVTEDAAVTTACGRHGDRQGRPRLGRRRHLHGASARVRLPVRRARLAQGHRRVAEKPVSGTRPCAPPRTGHGPGCDTRSVARRPCQPRLWSKSIRWVPSSSM